jgi:hypothetical protein
MLRTVPRPLHRVPVTRRASVDDAKPEEFGRLVGACRVARPALAGCHVSRPVTVGETLSPRLSDLHFADSSGALGCADRGAHRHVVPRANVKTRTTRERSRIVPVEGPLVGAFDHRLRRERDGCAVASGCDFVFVTFVERTVGGADEGLAVHKLFLSLSARAGA